jgi:hypothetical protein
LGKNIKKGRQKGEGCKKKEEGERKRENGK